MAKGEGNGTFGSSGFLLCSDLALDLGAARKLSTVYCPWPSCSTCRRTRDGPIPSCWSIRFLLDVVLAAVLRGIEMKEGGAAACCGPASSRNSQGSPFFLQLAQIGACRSHYRGK